MKEIYINCSCGGGASVKIPAESNSACTECACGKILLWSGEGTATIAGEATYSEWNDNPPTLGISVGDGAKVDDVFGG